MVCAMATQANADPLGDYLFARVQDEFEKQFPRGNPAVSERPALAPRIPGGSLSKAGAGHVAIETEIADALAREYPDRKPATFI